jgi:hypothetical protein
MIVNLWGLVFITRCLTSEHIETCPDDQPWLKVKKNGPKLNTCESCFVIVYAGPMPGHLWDLPLLKMGTIWPGVVEGYVRRKTNSCSPGLREWRRSNSCSLGLREWRRSNSCSPGLREWRRSNSCSPSLRVWRRSNSCLLGLKVWRRICEIKKLN